MRFATRNGILVPQKEDSLPISKISNLLQPPLNPHYSFSSKLQELLTGKQLLLDDLPFPLNDIIQEHYENGYVTYRKGITYIGKRPICTRCGNSDPHWFATMPCARCGEQCLYCRHCIMMGRINECTPLIGWNGPPPNSETLTKLDWKGTLSKGQQEASDRVVATIQQNKELLVWAVCGAGKTEILFKGIEAALAEQKRVCIATPRTDVVLELTPRLKAVFPQMTVASLYGGSEDRHLYAPLTIATTHQLLRFYQAFDTLILDEVDAFPYTVEESLQHAAVQARKPTSAMIYLTATPNEKWQRECRQGKRAFATIPARFHRRPLPVPKFEWCGNWQKNLRKGKLPPTILRWINERLAVGKQALIFFPHIPFMEKALPQLRILDQTIEAVHAEDPDRKEKVQKMRNKKISLLLTTTILERGVTFPNIDVAVVGAEDDIFTESALVQIAGRAGRSIDHPDGVVTFFHYGKTDAMIKAQKQIVAMNGEGVKRRLIDV